MRTQDNGFNRFMCKLEGKPFEIRDKWSIQELESVGSVKKTYIRSVLEGYTSDLMDAFTWSSTPQGYDYWESRYNRRTPMSAEDYSFVRILLEVRFP